MGFRDVGRGCRIPVINTLNKAMNALLAGAYTCNTYLKYRLASVRCRRWFVATRPVASFLPRYPPPPPQMHPDSNLCTVALAPGTRNRLRLQRLSSSIAKIRKRETGAAIHCQQRTRWFPTSTQMWILKKVRLPEQKTIPVCRCTSIYLRTVSPSTIWFDWSNDSGTWFGWSIG